MVSDSLKSAGNKAFAEGHFEEAVKFFSQAIEEDSSNHVLYSNRSAAFASMKKFDEALKDAIKTTEVSPGWPKGYSRLAAAYHGLGRLQEAFDAAEQGLKVDPSNESLKKSREDLEVAISKKNAHASEDSDVNPFATVLKDPAIWTKLATNPTTRPFLEDKAFREKFTLAIQNPGMAMQLLSSDSRMATAILSLMNINLPAGDDMGGLNDQEDREFSSPSSTNCNSSHCADPKCKPSNKNKSPQQKSHHAGSNSTAKAAGAAEGNQEEGVDSVKAEILKIREAGNAAYRKRSFEEAMAAYKQAFEKGGENDATLLNNMAAVCFERKEFNECISLAEQAIELVRKKREGFDVIAKAYARIGRAYEEGLNNLEAAVTNYKYSLTERRTPEIVKRLNELEKKLEKQKKDAYQSVELSDAARERGNVLFSAGQYAEAMKEYAEGIKRNENDVRGYANRSACYFKLGAFPEALRDAERCIQVDPEYIKGYVRKANVLLIKKDFAGALDMCEKAEEINELAIKKLEAEKTDDKSKDENSNVEPTAAPVSASAQSLPALLKQRNEIAQLFYKCNAALQAHTDKVHESGADSKDREEALKSAMSNPEVQAIMRDPGMRTILEQMTNDPKAVKEHMSNPAIAAKIRKLMAAGIISTR